MKSQIMKPYCGPHLQLPAIPACRAALIILTAASSFLSAELNAAETDSGVRSGLPGELTILKSDLAKGLRVNFPPGTAARNGSRFLALDLQMTWPQAQLFSEEHGAHLAVLPSEADRIWLRDHLPSDASYWIGAGKSPDGRWRWIDGSPWSETEPLAADTSHKQFMALTRKGRFLPGISIKRTGFILQWRDDGTNPGAVKAQLARTAASIKSKSSPPLYPIGTLKRENSHFFYYQNPLSWNEARLFASTVGAHLGVPSSAEEQKWIATSFSLTTDESSMIWLGGFRLKPRERWQWLTGERWNNHGWSLDQFVLDPELNRLALQRERRSRANWIASDGTAASNTGMLLEWGPPTESEPPAEVLWKPWMKDASRVVAEEVEAELKGLQERRKKLVPEYVTNMKKVARSGTGRRRPSNFFSVNLKFRIS